MKNFLLIILTLGFIIGTPAIPRAQSPVSTQKLKLTEVPFDRDTLSNPYILRIFKDGDGNLIEEIIVPGRPPKDYRAPVAKLPDPENKSANVLSDVPAFSWCFGCSATSAAMIAGYYDRTGYDNMYTGSANGGLMPLNNSTWPNVNINGETRAQCPLSATRMGVDGRTQKGHVDDYWYMYGSEQDPYYGNWTQHTYGECTADYMGTNQFHNFGVTDGATRFYSYNNGNPLYDYTGCEPGERDGCHGFRLFMESRGYDVQDFGNFSQRIYGYEGNTLGFTWVQFKDEIDAGRPVLIQVIGHTMVGYGYDESGGNQLVYIHDTWDYNDHTMAWGGFYSDMQHYGVVVMKLEPLATGTLAGQVTSTEGSTPIEGATISSGSFSAVTNSSGNYTINDLPTGTYQVVASHPQYITSNPETVTITQGNTSYQDFSLASAVSTITLFAPNGGEYFVSGSEAVIAWETTISGNVKIEYSSDNGGTWLTISSSIAASLQTYVWTVPDISSDQCLLKISDVSNLTVSDVSNSSFSIGTQNLFGGPYAWDENTVLLMHFEGDYHNQSPLSGDGIPQGNGLNFVNNELEGLGKCIEFNRSYGDPKISVPHNTNLSLDGDWTLETWFKTTDYDDYYQYLMVKPGDGDEYLSNYAMQINSYWDDVIFTYYFTSAEERVGLTGVTPSLDQWYHLTFIRDIKTSTLRLIIHDSNMTELFDSQIDDTGTDPLNNVQDVMVGLYYRGLMDELRISNVARNYDDIIKANFTADINYGEAPLEVSFSDLSDGSPTAWLWDFDNNGTTDSQLHNPVWTYTEPGSYSVKLSVSNGVSSDSKTKTNYITITGNIDQPPPQNLLVSSQGYASWEAPQIQTERIIAHHGGYSGSGIGTNSTASWICAARFDETDMETYYGSTLNAVNIHICEDFFSYVELRIYEGGSFGVPGALVYTQDITENVLINNWTTIPLASPIALEEGNEYWLGYYIDATGGYPSSNDLGSAIAGKGDWMFFDGSWIEISTAFDIDKNWCIEGLVSSAKDAGDKKLTQKQIQSHPPHDMIAAGTPPQESKNLHPVHQQPAKDQRDLMAYNVYLDDSLAGNTSNLFWQFTDLISGEEYLAGVSAYYSDGESEIIEDTFTYNENPTSHALDFDGDNDYVNCGHDASLHLTNALTIEAWIKPSGWGESTGYGFGRIMDKNKIKLMLVDNGNTNYNDHCLAFLFHSGSLSYQVFTQDNTISLDNWQHVAGTYNGNGEAHIYINGVEQVLSGTPPTGAIVNHSADDLYIGESANQARAFEGVIDEMRMWSVERSQTEIQNNMNEYLTGTETGLAAYWRMNKGSGQAVSDISGNGNNGQLGSSTGNDVGDPSWLATDWPYGSVLANFAANITSGDAPLNVQFTDLSTGDPNAWQWDFDNNGTIDSYNQNPQHSYTSPGTFSVALTVSDGSNSHTRLRQDYISVMINITGDTIFVKQDGTGHTTTIQAAINLAEDGQIVLVYPGTYYENINFDGKNITVGSRFLSTGDETFISQTIIDGGANGSVVSIVNGETAAAALTGFTITNGSTSGGGGIILNNTSPVLSHLWIVNNTATSYGGGLQHYGNNTPQVSYCLFSGNNSNTGGAIAVNDCESITFDHLTIADNTANYGAALMLTNAGVTLSNAILWDNQQRQVYFNNYYDPNYLEVNYCDVEGGHSATQQFTSNGTLVWGNGNLNTNPQFTNATSGDYSLAPASPCINTGNPEAPLDPDGTRTDMGAFYYNQQLDINAEFSADVTEGDAPLTVQFTDLSTGEPSSWEWDFDNNGAVDSYDPNPEWTYNEVGEYTVSLIVSSPAGSDTETKTNYITVTEPLAAEFSADVTEGDAPLLVIFSDLSTGDPTAWEWDFQNDSTIDSYLQNPEFTYTDPGVYAVSLTVSDSKGSDTETKTDYITVSEPLLAAFTADVTEGDAPLTVQFTDLSTGDPSSWEWDFENDGTIDSYDPNPEFTYTDPGVYSVSLTVYDSEGSDTETKTDYITVLEVPGTISDVTASQRTDGSKLVDIGYNLSGPQSSYPVMLEVSFNDGSSYEEVTEVSGDVGTVEPGTGLQMTWNAGTEFPAGFYYETVKMRVTATDEAWECGDLLTDTRDGQQYETVLIGEQCWMAENLNIGIRINGNVSMTNNDIVEKYCYNNDPANCDTYGGLYQWNEAMQYATTEGVQGICPESWHLATDDEWKILEGTVDSHYPVGDPIWNGTGNRGLDAGLNLKSASGWYSNGNGTDLYGFNGLPGGDRDIDGSFEFGNSYGHFWTSSSGWLHRLDYNNNQVFRNSNDPEYGFSVRCVKNPDQPDQGHSSIGNRNFSGESPAFTMDTKNPELTLSSPNGGEVYSYLELLDITWTATDDTFEATPVSAGISTEQGGAVTWLANNIANSGSTQLDPPDVATLFAKAHVNAMDAFGNEGSDASDNYFELVETIIPLAAEFSADVTEGDAPLTVQFTDLSTGDPTAWEWDFQNDGSIDSYLQNPEFTYNDPGVYTVSLAVSDSEGSDTETKTNYITVLDETGTISEVTASQRTDGSKMVDISYNLSGPQLSYPVILEVSFNDGSTYEEVTEVSGDIGTVEPGTGLQITWDAGAEFQEGFYYETVKMRVTAIDEGWTCGDLLTDARDGQQYETVLIGDQCWMARNLAYLPTVSPSSQWSTTVPYYYVYDYQGSDVAEAKATTNYQTYGVLYNWPSASVSCPSVDGWHLPSDDEWKILEGTADSQYPVGDPEWNYTNFRGFDAGYNLRSISGWYNNGNGSDLYGFSALPGGTCGYNGEFHSLSTHAGWWNSNENSTSSAWCRTMVYNNNQSWRNTNSKNYAFSVRCLKNPDLPDHGHSSSGSRNFSGESPAFIMDTKNPEVTLSTPNGGGIYSYQELLEITWSATDDTFEATPVSTGISTEESGAVTWLASNIANSGSTEVDPPDVTTLFAKAHVNAVDAFGNEGSDASDNYFELVETIIPLAAEFSADVTEGDAPLTVQFTDLSTGDPSSWEWDFENDGTIDSYDPNPEFTYTDPGIYSVSLTVYDGKGSSTETKMDYITVSEPLLADFSTDLTSGDAPLLVSFSDLSTGDPTAWEWDFENDGTIDSYDPNPEFTYTDPGIYSVSLTVYDGKGSSTETKIDYITVSEPLLADFSADLTSGDAPLLVSFSDLSTGDPTAWEWDFENDGTIDSYLQNPEFTYTLPGFYSVSIMVSKGENSDTETKTDYITVSSGGIFFDPVYETPYNPMTFYILEASIDDVTLQVGDEVGLFDTDPFSGNEICVGAGVLTEPLGAGTYLEMIASMNDGSIPNQANGFTPGHDIIYKLWSAAAGLCENVVSTYPYPGYDEVFTAQGNTLVELTGINTLVQDIDLHKGWNLMSFRVEPQSWDMLGIVQPLIDDDLLFKVLDEAGGSVFHLPFPPPNGQWTNTIGDMQNTEGYYIKTTGDATLSLEGAPLDLPMDIPLISGWNIAGYPCTNPQNALEAVQALIDAGVFFKMIDEAGGSIFHLPFPPPNGQWTNTIGNLQTNKGYYLKLTDDAVLTFDEAGKTTMPQYFPLPARTPTHFAPVYENNPYMPMHIALQVEDQLNAGDELAIFDGDYCVGAATVGEEGFIIVTTAMDDPASEAIDGFVSGNTISAKAWSAATGEEIMAELLYNEGEQRFSALGTFIGKIGKTITSVSDITSDALSLRVIPNPFRDEFNLGINLPCAGQIRVEIFDLTGKKAKHLSGINVVKGSNSIAISDLQLEQGTYLLSVIYSNDDAVRRISRKIIKK